VKTNPYSLVLSSVFIAPGSTTGSATVLGGSDGTFPHSPDSYRRKPILMRRVVLVNLSVAATALAVALIAAPTAGAHRNVCHTRHDCPSDHHTYRWGTKGLLCTSYADERRAADKTIVRYAGRRYWCGK
jgi:hypothetical protein